MCSPFFAVFEIVLIMPRRFVLLDHSKSYDGREDVDGYCQLMLFGCFCVAVDTSVAAAVGHKLEYMLYFLLRCGDATGVFAFDDIYELFRCSDMLFLDDLSVTDEVDRRVRCYVSYNVK